MAKQKHSEVSLLQYISGYSFQVARLALAICLLIMLITYDPTDGGFFTTTIDASQINNAIGIIGAYFADLFIHLLGAAAYVLPIFLILLSSQVFFNFPPAQKTTLVMRYSTLLGLIVALSVLLSLHVAATSDGYPQGAGGMLGAGLGHSMIRVFGLWGSNIILLVMVFLTVSYQLSLAWENILIKTGQFVERRGMVTWHYITKNENEIPAIQKPVHESVMATTSEKGHLGEGKFGGVKGILQKLLKKQANHSQNHDQINYADQPGATQTRNEAVSDKDVLDALGAIDQVETATQATDNIAPTPEVPRKEPRFTEFRTPDLDITKAAKAQEAQSAATTKTAANNSDIDTAPLVNSTQLNNSGDAINKATTYADSDKRDVKIVPLEQTHKQDTGTSSVTAQQKRKKSKACPPVSLLDAPSVSMNPGLSKEEIQQMSDLLELKLLDFGVVAEVVEVNPGPVITRFEIQPAPGTKVSKISNLAKDLARSMAVLSVRVVEVIAGKSVIGLEIPNQNREMVCISEVLGSKTYETSDSPLTMGLGNDIAGKPVVVDLAKMPHLLVAGTTGSGKSVGVNAMIISLLLKSTPDQIRLLLVDPKMLELSIYDGIPHLLAPVITDMKEAAGGLRWCVAEMERRYKIMASQGVRNIAGYNQKVNAADLSGTPIPDPTWQPDELLGQSLADRPALEEFPYIVVVVDEFADMMMIVGKKVEELIARIAQKARAAGIHLILATQRPSVDVITGLIKANVPTRIAFQVSSKIDSRTILDQGGAESLLGHGDMLYLPAGKSMPERVHGAFVSDDEVHRVVEDWKKRGAPEFVDAIIKGTYDQEASSSGSGNGSEGSYEEEQDSLYDDAVAFVTETRRASISSVQRHLRIGYNRAARMIEAMEAAGVITSQSHNGSREVLAPPPVKD